MQVLDKLFSALKTAVSSRNVFFLTSTNDIWNPWMLKKFGEKKMVFLTIISFLHTTEKQTILTIEFWMCFG